LVDILYFCSSGGLLAWGILIYQLMVAFSIEYSHHRLADDFSCSHRSNMYASITFPVTVAIFFVQHHFSKDSDAISYLFLDFFGNTLEQAIFAAFSMVLTSISTEFRTGKTHTNLNVTFSQFAKICLQFQLCNLR
jgi:hypothetical protein